MQDSNYINNECILRLENIRKVFPGVVALNNVNFNLKAGEIHALIGENGAGKSTLIKIITGAYKCDSGSMYIQGKAVKFNNAIEAQNLGISAVYQEFNLVPQLNAYQNIFLRKQPQKGKLIKRMDKKFMKIRSKELIRELGVNFDIELPIRSLSIAFQQMVEIAKAMAWDSKIFIFDEPTATLTEEETRQLFNVIRKLKEKKVGVIYISHHMEEIYQIADRATILRDGKWIETYNIKEQPVNIDTIISKMVGRELVEQYPKIQIERGGEILRLEHTFSQNRFKDVSFSLYSGEILGITGLVGAGRTEVAKTIFGVYPLTKGTIYLEGKKVKINSPSDAIRLGISLAPEDRKNEGLVQILSIQQNMIMANQGRFTHGGIFDTQKVKITCNELVTNMKIKTDTIERKVKFLSGGNQQKVVLAKWLIAHSKVVIFDEPTRGIDVGAKVEVYNLINELVKNKVGIIMISSEMPEIIGMSDRILVMREGKISAELSGSEVTQETIMKHAAI
jgi:ABC-type sugar transport system ATPase subunit